MPEVEVRIVITVLTVDEALQHICATFREEAELGDLTPTERDLLIDGAILLAMNVDDMSREGRFGSDSGCPEGTLPRRAGRHERPRLAAAC
jgi:hypothetical protein